jgi:hypothetical protein
VPQQQSFFSRLSHQIFASRFLTFSLLLHVVIVVIGGSVVIIRQSTPDFPPPTGHIDMPAADPLVDPIMPAPMPALMLPAPPSPAVPSIAAAMNAPSANPIVSTPRTHFAAAADAARSATIELPTFGVPAFKHRGAEGRRQMIIKNNGSDVAEAAVMRGLRWLAQHQNADGSWSDEHGPSITGLALLAFLGHGEDQRSHDFGPVVGKAVNWLLARGEEFDGRLSLTKDGWGGHQGVYEHAIATYALADYFAFTKDLRAEPLLRKAVGYIVAGQASDGGWNYGYTKEPNSDTSVSGWQIQALKAAHLTALAIPGVDEAMDKAMLNLKRVQTEDGNFHYRKAGDRAQNASLVGVGVLGTLLWKDARDKMAREGIDFMLDRARPRVKYQGEEADLYAWYYNTQAALLYGGNAWAKWNGMFQDQLVKGQAPDGSWPPVKAKGVPAGELQRMPTGVGPFYRTALCVLMLESYYRNVF